MIKHFKVSSEFQFQSRSVTLLVICYSTNCRFLISAHFACVLSIHSFLNQHHFTPFQKTCSLVDDSGFSFR